MKSIKSFKDNKLRINEGGEHIKGQGNKIKDSVVGFFEWIVLIIATLIISGLTVMVFLFEFNTENSIPFFSKVYFHLAVFGLVLLVFYIIGRFLNRFKKFCILISILFFMATVSVVGMLCLQYISQVLLWPESDQKACYVLALAFLQSDFSSVVPTGSYLSLWPFQTGFIFVMEKMMRFFKDTSPLLFQKANVFYVLLIISSGYGTVCTITKRIEGRILYLILMATYCPLLFNVTRIYGDIPGLAWMMFSAFCITLYYKTSKKWIKIIVALTASGSMVAACIYKRNCLIFVVAFLLVMLVMQLKKRNILFAFLVLIAVFLSAFGTKFTQKYYEYYADNTMGNGVPAIAYVAMALQYNGEEAIPGGWNGFHYKIFMESDYDYEKTVILSEESIKESLQEFRDDPSYAVQFFYNKIRKQWANQTHGIYWSVSGSYDTTRNSNDFWVIYLTTGQYRYLVDFEDYHESIVYGLILLSCLLGVWAKIKKEKIQFYYLLPIITFIGGFLFSILWEGQTQAVIYYPIMALPSAIGIISLHLETPTRIEKRNNKK